MQKERKKEKQKESWKERKGKKKYGNGAESDKRE